MAKKLFVIGCASFVSLMILSACSLGGSSGDGRTWQAIDYTGGPYSEERTAGKGVKYVLAMMAPEKGAQLKPVLGATKMEEPPMPIVAAPLETVHESDTALVTQSADESFQKQQVSKSK